MSQRISSTLLGSLVDVDCPACGFGFEIEMVDAATGVTRWCPCCRTTIELSEGGGEVHGAMEDIDSAMRSLERTLGGLFS